ncbi:MAG: cytochrome c oxidase subunit II [Candidatus Pelagibacterales bacterium]|jgi:cytochrome c oxidase subunit 2|tara:strand:- start:1242 stop:2069 length:828 start_codon:yes stop_codon:yes gene_type:complete
MKYLSLIFIALFSFLSNASSTETLPKDWQLGFSEPATELMSDVIAFHSYILMPIITGISILVLALLLYIAYRYNSNRNQIASTTTHNTVIEVLWTVIPVILLIIIAIPSFRILYTAETIPKADLTIKAIGNQWYWSYEYPDYDDFSFDANMLQDEELSDPSLRLLETDTQIVVPVNKVVKLLITSNDVLHAWTIPAFAVKKDAVPGRLNETWFKAEKTGTYYGQCSELCGPKHAFMPINVKVVSQDEFDNWLNFAKEEYASSKTNFNQTFQVAKN